MTYTILHLSDPHFGAADQQQADLILEHASRLKPDFAIVSGDFSMRARKNEMTAAQQWLNQLPCDLITIPGNHDVPLLNQPIDRFFRPFRRYKKYINGNLEPVVDLPVGRLLCFNSSTPFGLHIDWSRGFLSPFQARRIETGFSRSNGYRLVTFHHPLHRKDDTTRVLISPLPQIKRSLARAKADIVFAGHFHQSYVGVIELNLKNRNLVVSQASTACSTRTKGEPAGFHVVMLNRDQIEIQRFAWKVHDFIGIDRRYFTKANERWSQHEINTR